jgi:hypothetical protein
MNYSNYFIQELNYLYSKAIINKDTILQTELKKEIDKRNWNKFVEPKKQILVTKNGITTATLVNI